MKGAGLRLNKKLHLVTLRLRRTALWAGPLLVAYERIYSRFYPGPHGTVGHDYAAFLPWLLEGYYWSLANSWWRIPYFTPAFCGGVPFFGEPQSPYYSLPQLLTFWMPPLSAVWGSQLLLAALGLVGTYLLLRRAFVVSEPAAWLGAAIFLFNGFFSHRMLVGHLAFHQFMLIPWLAFFLLAPAPKGTWLRERLLYPALTAACAAYIVGSGMVNGVVPVAIAVMLLLLVHRLLEAPAAPVVERLAFAVPLAIAASAAKLVATSAFVASMPERPYPLPGIDSLWDAVLLLGRTLFFVPPETSRSVLANSQWLIERHELEYGVGPLPLLALALATGRWAIGMWHDRAARAAWRARWGQRPRWLLGSGLVLLLIVPLAVNFYSPSWNAFLKSVPIVKSSSTLLRWWSSYIPLLAVATALVAERIFPPPRRTLACALLAAFVVLWHAAQDRTFYENQPYQPAQIQAAWSAAAQSQQAPPVTAIAVELLPDASGSAPAENDLLVVGASQLRGYYPMFGYRLENFPLGTLQPGDILATTGDRLNIKNPACYVYPAQNHCRPGDHFTTLQVEEAKRFARRAPFAFEVSGLQSLANAVNALALLAIAGVLLACARRAPQRARSQM